jgi:ABC-type bacteriocin/lantibiotic exporter with double-glycine peptidase domain
MDADKPASSELAQGEPLLGADRADPLLQALLRLIRQLERPCAEAELRNAVAVPEGGADPACLVRVAERVGLSARLEHAGRRRLESTSPPYLLFGHEPGKVWLVRARTGRHLVLVDPVEGGASAFTPRQAA